MRGAARQLQTAASDRAIKGADASKSVPLCSCSAPACSIHAACGQPSCAQRPGAHRQSLSFMRMCAQKSLDTMSMLAAAISSCTHVRCAPRSSSGPAGGERRRRARRRSRAPGRPLMPAPPVRRPPHLRRLHLGARHRAQSLWARRSSCARCQPETVPRAAASAVAGGDPEHEANSRGEGRAQQGPADHLLNARAGRSSHSPPCCQP